MYNNFVGGVCASKQFEKILMTLYVPVGVYFS